MYIITSGGVSDLIYLPIGTPGSQASPELAENGLCGSCCHPRSITTPSLHNVRNETQGSVHARQALCQPSYIPILTLFKGKKLCMRDCLPASVRCLWRPKTADPFGVGVPGTYEPMWAMGILDSERTASVLNC